MQFGSSALLTALAAFIVFSLQHRPFLRMADSSSSGSLSSMSASIDVVPAVIADSPWKVRQVTGVIGMVRLLEGFEGPYGLTVLPDGTLFVMDSARGRVVRFSATLEAQGLLDPQADATEFPHALARIADGTFLVPDHRKGWIKRYASDGKFLGKFFADPPSPELAFVEPVNVYVDHAQNIWVADYGAHRIFKFDPEGTFLGWKGAKAEGEVVSGFATSGTSRESALPGGFNQPHMVAVDRAGEIFVVDVGNHRVQKFAADGTFVGWIGAREDGTLTDGWTKEGRSTAATMPGGFQRPISITLAEGLTRQQDMLIISDNPNHRIVRFRASDGRFFGWMGERSDGSVTAGWEMSGEARTGSQAGAFKNPFTAQIWNGFLYVADRGNKRVQIIPLR